MSYACKILADSVSPAGDRLTTFEVTFPRFILAEVNTHRMLSRNSASSRAIPVAKAIAAVRDSPFIPAEFGVNMSGMLWEDVLSGEEHDWSLAAWTWASVQACSTAERLDELGVHKALANRVIEPFKWHTAILTATDWDNFFALRTDKNAQPEFRVIAEMMLAQYQGATPLMTFGGWHLPLVESSEVMSDIPVISPDRPEWTPDWGYWKKVSVGRCARVSYLTHDGVRDPEADIALHDRLMTSGHLSPFEHQGTPFTDSEHRLTEDILDFVSGSDISASELARFERNLKYDQNLKGWHNYRSYLPHQDNFKEAQKHAITTG